MITHFKRGILKRNGITVGSVAFLAKSHTSIIHRGQRFFITYIDSKFGLKLNITHGPTGMAVPVEKMKLRQHDRTEDIEYKLRKCLDENWNKVIETAKGLEKRKWKY